MSTRSFIAVPFGGGFKARYAHWDGYPTWMGRQLHAIVVRDGVEAARTMLTETHQAWSAIKSTLMEPDDVHSGPVEPGYGAFYNEVASWSLSTDKDSGDIEWAYVLHDDRIAVLKRARPPRWTPVGDLHYDRTYTDAELTAIECGPDFERCQHVVSAHLPGTPHPRLAMTVYLGHEPRGWEERIAVIVNGQRIELGGSGRTGTATSTAYPFDPHAARYWWSSIKGDDMRDLRIARITKRGYKLDHDTVLAPTRDLPEMIVKAGTTI